MAMALRILIVEDSETDAGVGLDGDPVNKVFKPYSTAEANGMGLGLSINRTIIEAHGGNLSAGRNCDRGATFRFTLPADRGKRGGRP